MRFIEEIRTGTDYVITTTCSALRTTSMTLDQAIWAEGRKRATFSCVMVLLTQDGSDRMPIPQDIRSKLIADGAVEH